MSKDEMLWVASVAFAKNMDSGELYYSDYMNGKEVYTDEVWEYVTEIRDNGLIWFYNEYKEYKLYGRS